MRALSIFKVHFRNDVFIGYNIMQLGTSIKAHLCGIQRSGVVIPKWNPIASPYCDMACAWLS